MVWFALLTPGVDHKNIGRRADLTVDNVLLVRQRSALGTVRAAGRAGRAFAATAPAGIRAHALHKLQQGWLCICRHLER